MPSDFFLEAHVLRYTEPLGYQSDQPISHHFLANIFLSLLGAYCVKCLKLFLFYLKELKKLEKEKCAQISSQRPMYLDIPNL